MFRLSKLALFATCAFGLAACAPVSPQGPDTPPAATEPAPFPPTADTPYVAVGTEPFWSVKIEGQRVTFQPMEGKATVADNVSVRPSFNGWRYTSDTVSVDVTFSPCNDGMSDIVYKDTVTVLVGTTEFRGCGGGAVTPGANLANTQWSIASVNGQDVYNPLGRGPLMVRFGQNGLSAATGCNGMGGNFVSSEGWIYTPSLIGTEMACDARLMAQEQAIAIALSGHKTIRNGAEGSIILGVGNDNIVLAPVGACPECSDLDGPRANDPIEGKWDIRQIGAKAILNPNQPYVMSLSNGALNGYAGCNRFSGSFSASEKTLAVGPVMATRMACAGEGGEDERSVLAMLRSPMEYRLIGDGLLLLSNETNGLVLVRTGL